MILRLDCKAVSCAPHMLMHRKQAGKEAWVKKAKRMMHSTAGKQCRSEAARKALSKG